MKTNLYNPCRYFIVMLMLFYTGIADIKAQSQFEFAFSYGPSNFLGDLGGNSGKGAGFLKDNMVSLTRFMGGANLLYRPNEFINFRLSLNIGKLEGADSLIAGKGGWEEARKARNQHFGHIGITSIFTRVDRPVPFETHNPVFKNLQTIMALCIVQSVVIDSSNLGWPCFSFVRQL